MKPKRNNTKNRKGTTDQERITRKEKPENLNGEMENNECTCAEARWKENRRQKSSGGIQRLVSRVPVANDPHQW